MPIFTKQEVMILWKRMTDQPGININCPVLYYDYQYREVYGCLLCNKLFDDLGAVECPCERGNEVYLRVEEVLDYYVPSWREDEPNELLIGE